MRSALNLNIGDHPLEDSIPENDGHPKLPKDKDEFSNLGAVVFPLQKIDQKQDSEGQKEIDKDQQIETESDGVTLSELQLNSLFRFAMDQSCVEAPENNQPLRLVREDDEEALQSPKDEEPYAEGKLPCVNTATEESTTERKEKDPKEESSTAAIEKEDPNEENSNDSVEKEASNEAFFDSAEDYPADDISATHISVETKQALILDPTDEHSKEDITSDPKGEETEHELFLDATEVNSEEQSFVEQIQEKVEDEVFFDAIEDSESLDNASSANTVSEAEIEGKPEASLHEEETNLTPKNTPKGLVLDEDIQVLAQEGSMEQKSESTVDLESDKPLESVSSQEALENAAYGNDTLKQNVHESCEGKVSDSVSVATSEENTAAVVVLNPAAILKQEQLPTSLLVAGHRRQQTDRLKDNIYNSLQSEAEDKEKIVMEAVDGLEALSSLHYTMESQALLFLWGSWQLIYTTDSLTTRVISALEAAHFLDAFRLSLHIDSEAKLVYSKMWLKTKLLKDFFDGPSEFVIRTSSESLLESKQDREDGLTLLVPQILTAIDLSELPLPESVRILGFSLERSQLQSLWSRLAETARSGLKGASSLARLLEAIIPEPLIYLLKQRRTQLLKLTYLDSQFCVFRQEEEIFIFQKHESPTDS